MFTFVDDADDVCVLHGGEPVRDDDGRPALRRRLQRLLHALWGDEGFSYCGT